MSLSMKPQSGPGALSLPHAPPSLTSSLFFPSQLKPHWHDSASGPLHLLFPLPGMFLHVAEVLPHFPQVLIQMSPSVMSSMSPYASLRLHIPLLSLIFLLDTLSVLLKYILLKEFAFLPVLSHYNVKYEGIFLRGEVLFDSLLYLQHLERWTAYSRHSDNIWWENELESLVFFNLNAGASGIVM